MDKFLDTYDHPKLNQEDINHLNRFIIQNEIKAAIKNLPKKKKEPSQASTTTLENNMEASLKTNVDLPYDPAIPLLGIYPKECDSGYSKGTCTPMFIAALIIIVKLWKQPRCPTKDKWIKKMWYLYTMEFYSATEKNEILSFTSKCMELKHIILNEVMQARKAKNCMFSLICGL
jgi:hypothetical protein